MRNKGQYPKNIGNYGRGEFSPVVSYGVRTLKNKHKNKKANMRNCTAVEKLDTI
jgi:hypothetical protein